MGAWMQVQSHSCHLGSPGVRGGDGVQDEGGEGGVGDGAQDGGGDGEEEGSGGEEWSQVSLLLDVILTLSLASLSTK